MGDFVELLGSGKDHACKLTYRVQDEAGGIAWMKNFLLAHPRAGGNQPITPAP